MDENSCIEQVENNSDEQFENDEVDNIIQECKPIKLKPQVSDEPYPSLGNMLILLDNKSQQKVAHPETSITKHNTYFPLTLGFNKNL